MKLMNENLMKKRITLRENSLMGNNSGAQLDRASFQKKDRGVVGSSMMSVTSSND